MTCPRSRLAAGADADDGTDDGIGTADAGIAAEAEAFLAQLRAEQGDRAVPAGRLAQVRTEIMATGTYHHSAAELTAGAKLAWRNTPRCLGKFYWNGLAVRDLRQVRSAEDMFEALVEHLRLAGNGGRVRLLLSVFAQQEPGAHGPRIWNSQLVRYAGYRQPDGTVLGDPDSVEFTAAARALGWAGGPGTPFDLLPLVIQLPGQPPRVFELPPDAVLEVPIVHPDYPWFADLGLRWYAFPSVSNQRLEIGGVSYPAAPFSGWYTCTEIGARNLSDAHRYNMLPAIAARMGLDVGSDRSLWKDRAMVELTAAALHSFDLAGVSMIDHHFATRQFVRHETRERAARRATPADWALIVPPTGGSATPVWERRYERTVLRPNFFPQPAPWQAGSAS